MILVIVSISISSVSSKYNASVINTVSSVSDRLVKVLKKKKKDFSYSLAYLTLK